MDECLQRLIDRIESGEDLRNLIPSESISKLVKIRLEMQAPYISKWPQALSIQVCFYLSFAIFQSWEFVLTEQINTKILALKKKETFCSFIGRHNHWMYLQVLSSEQCWLMRSGILWVMRHLILIGMWNAPFLEEYTHQLKCTCWLIVPQVHSLCAWNFYTLEHVYLVFVAFICFHWVVRYSLLVCPCWSLNCPDLNIYRIVLSTGVIVCAISFPLFLFCWISPGQYLLIPPFGCLLVAMQVAITHC